MNINIKLEKGATLPKYSREGDCGMDLIAINKTIDVYKNVCYNTGVHVQIPDGYVGMLFPRSSVCKENLLLSNSVGIIDTNYTGEIILKYKRLFVYSFNYSDYNIGDKIGQLVIVPIPKIEFNIVEQLEETNRGEKGFGSSGK